MKKCMTLLLTLLLLIGTVVGVCAEPEELIDLHIQMTLSQEDGNIVASLIDHRGGTVSSWPVSLEIDGEVVATVNTDAGGDAVFEYDIPVGTSEVACVAHDGQYDVYRFIGCSMYLENVVSSEDTTANVEQTTTTAIGTDNTPAGAVDILAGGQISTTDSLSVAPVTTTVNNTQVGIGVDVDAAFLNACGVSASDYIAQARMWIDKTVYDALVSTSSATLHLQLELNETAGTQTALVAAKNADPNYASFTDDQVKGFAMDMSLVYVDETNRVPLEIEDGMYEVEIPLPTSMKNCDKIAVSVCTSEGLTSLIEVEPVGGMLNFTVQRFQTLAIVGFGEHAAAIGSLSQTPWLLTVVVIGGVLLIGGGIALFVLVVFRRTKQQAGQSDAQEEVVSSSVLPALNNVAVMDGDDVVDEDRTHTVMFSQSGGKRSAAERFRPKAEVRNTEFDAVDVKAVPPSGQITNDKLDAVLSEAATATVSERVSVDDLLDELMSDIEDLGSE